MDFLRGMDGDDTAMAISPQLSLLDVDPNFFGDSMFPSPIEIRRNTQEMEAQSFVQPAALDLNVNTTISTALGIDVPLQNGAIGDRFYGIQQAPQHARVPSLTSPSIVMGDRPFSALAQEPGQYYERDFVQRGENHISLQSSDVLVQSGLDIDLITKVSENFNVQRPPIFGPNMHGIVALRVVLAAICQPLRRNPPTDADLLTFLSQGVTRVRDGSAPQIQNSGIDRPLALEHLLMMLHRYGLRNNEQYNLGLIRPSAQAPQFGAAPTYVVTIEGPKTAGSKTIWLFQENGEWYPLAQDNFARATKTYADAVKTPAETHLQRPTTPVSNDSFLHPSLYSPSTPYTPSDGGSDATGATSLSCRSCGKKFDVQSELTHHIRNHRHRALACLHCNRSFLWNKDLRRHMQTHVGKETRMDFICQVLGCTKAYTRQDNLRRHHRQDHPNLPPLAPTSVASSHRSHRSKR
jgi:hypothetical protein